MIKKILFWIVLINLFGLQTIAQSDIIPLKKPIQSDELTQKKLLIDVLKPLPRFCISKKSNFRNEKS